MTARNDRTTDAIRPITLSELYLEGWDRVFGSRAVQPKPKRKRAKVHKQKSDYSSEEESTGPNG
jgi:hypothetical protein